jgi:hypothetical protein
MCSWVTGDDLDALAAEAHGPPESLRRTAILLRSVAFYSLLLLRHLILFGCLFCETLETGYE